METRNLRNYSGLFKGVAIKLVPVEANLKTFRLTIGLLRPNRKNDIIQIV